MLVLLQLMFFRDAIAEEGLQPDALAGGIGGITGRAASAPGMPASKAPASRPSKSMISRASWPAARPTC